MTVKKLTLVPGVNKENTQYNSEGKWWACDKVRFRQGTPEQIGGWDRVSDAAFQGRCRALFAWTTLLGRKMLAVGTNLKYYIMYGGAYYDITPIRVINALTDPFDTTDTSAVVLVTDVAHGAATGSFVTFSGASAVGGITIDGEYQITVVSANTYNIEASVVATSTANGGGAVSAAYQINIGTATHGVSTGWGAGQWSAGAWGNDSLTPTEPRMWTQRNYGEDLVVGDRYGQIYYWTSSGGFTNNRAVNISTLPGASDTPIYNNAVTVSDVSRFVVAFGANELGSTTPDPMLIRWSDQEDVTMWTPSITNQAGGMRLSAGSEIAGALQVRQEILVWTDTALYAMQYIGAPLVWSFTLLADNVSCMGPNTMAVASGVVYWMGTDKFYTYNGTVSTLKCDLRQHIFGNINHSQPYQCFAATNESFNEIWWFYCTSGSTVPDAYVVFNYTENIWYYGTMVRTAWLDRGLTPYPQATDLQRVLVHEYGVDDNAGENTLAISSYVESAEFDIDDGDSYGFVYRILPDITFRGSEAANPSVQVTLIPMKNAGSGYGTSVGGVDNAPVVRSAEFPVEEFTGQVYIRIRGRQMVMRIESEAVGTTWQLGGMRIDVRQDGRRG